MTTEPTKKWTSGPWRVGKAGPNQCPTVGTNKGLMVAMVAHGDNHPTQANAHLISAAPELYEALFDVLDGIGALGGKWWELEDYGIPKERCIEIVETLEKARGES